MCDQVHNQFEVFTDQVTSIFTDCNDKEIAGKLLRTKQCFILTQRKINDPSHINSLSLFENTNSLEFDV